MSLAIVFFTDSNVVHCKAAHVYRWVAKSGFEEYAENFQRNEVDGALLLGLGSIDLQDDLRISNYLKLWQTSGKKMN